MGFGQGLSGLNAAAQSLDIIGNNIANSSTVGFKASTATFADIYASSRVGLGVQLARVNQRFAIGTVTGTGNQFDIAIDGAQGLFRVEDTSGNVLYTRNGQFYANEEHYIVNAQGQRLTGYPVASANPEPIRVPSGNIAPQATLGIDMTANFDANAAVISATGEPARSGTVTLQDSLGVAANFYYRLDAAGQLTWYPDALTDSPDPAHAPAAGTYSTLSGDVIMGPDGQIVSGEFPLAGGDNQPFRPALAMTPFDPVNGDSFTHSQPVNVFDSLGNMHQLMQYFVKREGEPGSHSRWDVYYRLDGGPVNASLQGGIPVTGPVSIEFDAAGRMISGQTVALHIGNPGGVNSPALPLDMTVRYAGSTQFGGDFSSSFYQDGYATGEYASMSIARDGSIVAHYTNGQTQAMGTLVLADFNNLQGLQPVGGNAWIESSESGQPILGVPGTNGLATLMGQAVEESNVDMSQELVNMIIAQRTYQANAQTIKTQDQILQTLITLR